MKRNNKGFTLAEMLIVVAIIGVLISIISAAISNSLEKTREATDLANIRSALSELSMYAITDEQANIPTYVKYDGERYITYVKTTQKQTGWQSSNIEKNSEGKAMINGTPVNAGNFSKNDRAYKIAVTVDGKLSVTLATFINIDADCVYFHTNELIRK